MMMRGRSRLNESKKESKKKKEKLSWLKRISSSAVIQALMLATTKNRHFVAMFCSSLAISQISARLIAGGRRSFLGQQRYAFPFFFGLIWFLFYNTRVVETPVLRFQRSFFNVHIVQRAMLASLRFRPIFYAYNRHAQTVVCFVLSIVECVFKTYRYERETIVGFDGRNQHIDWAVPYTDVVSKSLQRVDRSMNARSPVIILVHGLGDDRYVPYVFCSLSLSLSLSTPSMLI